MSKQAKPAQRHTSRSQGNHESMADIVRHGATGALGSMTQAAAELQDRAGQQVAEWREGATDFAAERMQEMRAAQSAVTERISKRPVAAVLAAAGIGFVLGAIWRRR